ncbi:MAG: alpha/beta fold hydrolase [Pseudomonadota bacterium]
MLRKIFPLFLGGILVVVITGVGALIREGQLITPRGQGSVNIASKRFEAYPLPDYAAKAVTDEYKSYFVEVEPGIKVHVLDVGTGFPVFMQHGNPTSGFLYRKVAAQLPLDRVRLIMPTMVGLGFSTKVPAGEHTLANHVRWINELLLQLDLKELVFVGQDWGGPVGMGALAMSPELLKGAVVMNTVLNAPTEERDLSSVHALAKTPVIGELFLELLVPIFDRMHTIQGDPESMNDGVADLYGRPVLESGNDKAPLALMRMVPDSPAHASTPQFQLIEQYVQGLNIPTELVWGMNDPILADALPVMILNFPNATVTKTEAGHFLQEEVPSEIAMAIMRVVDVVLEEQAEQSSIDVQPSGT